MTLIRDTIRQSILFSSLQADLIDRIAGFSSMRDVAQGETIFVQGEPSNGVFLIVRGWVKLYRVAPSGTEAVVSVKTRGHSFAEAVAIRGTPYPVSAEAATEASLIVVDARKLRHLIETEPDVAKALLISCVTKLQSFVTQVEQLKARSGSQRVAEFLIELADDKDSACHVDLPYNKVLIAGRLGMKPESLSRAFRRLRDYGVRIDGNRAWISDLQQLIDFASEDPSLPWTKG
ncbi:MAG: Crp/Fnr family transcriptional regulator [Paracoccus sp. (in: a-proteobacteria)]|uniref:Crp/Fnr family transcriptional regulator n=1 Tax=Paracoccus sp. TaxID=267 RepID=UPI0026E0CFBB|nr:Crp/Fnr family transcriptional regulator [Paracoccus sp. (in: a-proteobacteria)]MDO5630315.1 Crp/Fnr family transcriptional regulator [Paracoccus sp. (in: a-proteobacteria)]